jgi:carbon-monoxide dehydrogenase small subunit
MTFPEAGGNIQSVFRGANIMNQKFEINVNGKMMSVMCSSDRTLIDVLREDLCLTGTKRGCDIGACGTCTVLIDGKVRRACKVKIKDVGVGIGTGASSPPSITTIEGLSSGDKLHPIQEAFMKCGAIQCGFCTPGMVLAAKALLDSNPHPTRDEIKKALAGNLCRCTGYKQIFEAIEAAAKELTKGK